MSAALAILGAILFGAGFLCGWLNAASIQAGRDEALDLAAERRAFALRHGPGALYKFQAEDPDQEGARP